MDNLEGWLHQVDIVAGGKSHHCAEKAIACLSSLGYELMLGSKAVAVSARTQRWDSVDVAAIQLWRQKHWVQIGFNLPSVTDMEARGQLDHHIKGSNFSGYRWHGENLNGFPSFDVDALWDESAFNGFKDLAKRLRMQLAYGKHTRTGEASAISESV